MNQHKNALESKMCRNCNDVKPLNRSSTNIVKYVKGCHEHNSNRV